MMRLDVRGATDHLTRITGKSPQPNVCFHWSCPPAPARRTKIELRRSPEMFVQPVSGRAGRGRPPLCAAASDDLQPSPPPAQCWLNPNRFTVRSYAMSPIPPERRLASPLRRQNITTNISISATTDEQGHYRIERPSPASM